MFTIEIKKQKKNENFGLEDLTMNHQECSGGRVSFRRDFYPAGELYFECSRCRETAEISDKVELKIIQTAINGEEKKLSNNIRIIQVS
ncbi:MAG: hypothetical protein Q8O59_01600 [bacterium]|nr:hypothetical protein [bacterium]